MESLLMQPWGGNKLQRAQRSKEVKWDKLCSMTTIFGQKNCYRKLRIEVKGQQRSNEMDCVLSLPNLVRRTVESSLYRWSINHRALQVNLHFVHFSDFFFLETQLRVDQMNFTVHQDMVALIEVWFAMPTHNASMNQMKSIAVSFFLKLLEYRC